MRVLLLVLVGALSAAALKEPKYVLFDGEDGPKYMFDDEIAARIEASPTKWVQHMDLSDHKDFLTAKPGPFKEPSPIPNAPQFQSVVEPIVAMVDVNELESCIWHLSNPDNYFTRFDTTDDGVAAALWIADKFKALKGDRSDITVELYRDGTPWPQKSVIVTIPGTESTEIAALGGHLDSIGRTRNGQSHAPGADDDASGVCAMMEAFRVLIEGDYHPRRTLQFLAFAAEETGLRGSTDMVDTKYIGPDTTPMMGMLQSEMNGYQVNPEITLVYDQYTDATLTDFVDKMRAEYLSPEYSLNTATCGVCSDHVPFNRRGYRVAAMAEAGPFGNVNPYMHTERDTVNKMTMLQVAEFAKLGAAFCVEMGSAPDS